MNLLLSRFETYLLDEEQVEQEVTMAEEEQQVIEKCEYPEGFFSGL